MFGYRKIKLIVSLLAAVLLGAGAGALAQVPDQTSPREARHPGPMRGMERLHRQLNLNPQQEDLWKTAQAASKDAFRKMMAGSREMRDRLRAEIDKPGADLKQFAQLRDQLREQMRPQIQAARNQMHVAWFAVYDALDAGQKEIVRLSIKKSMDRTGHRHRGGSVGLEDADPGILG